VTTVTARAPGKVNLGLAVGPRRPDGYHELVNVFHAVALGDEVHATTLPAGQFELHVEGEGADEVPHDDENLVIQAARLLATSAGVDAGARLHLVKSIPVAAGMAGGSADAAATLVACDALWGTRLGASDLHEIAAGLGSDVNFALLGGTAIGTGRGEVLRPVACPATLCWVFAFAWRGLSTTAVYAELDRLRAGVDIGHPVEPPGLLAALAAGDPARLAGCLGNDLQPAALSLAPALAGTLETGRRLGALAGLVSGSGPTCAFLAADAAAADQLAARLAAAGACRTAVATTGPARGAHAVDLP
jgi:4-diphosphocytidyl-2-C-methyl-D-erythritol kinase